MLVARRIWIDRPDEPIGEAPQSGDAGTSERFANPRRPPHPELSVYQGQGHYRPYRSGSTGPMNLSARRHSPGMPAPASGSPTRDDHRIPSSAFTKVRAITDPTDPDRQAR